MKCFGNGSSRLYRYRMVPLSCPSRSRCLSMSIGTFRTRLCTFAAGGEIFKVPTIAKDFGICIVSAVEGFRRSLSPLAAYRMNASRKSQPDSLMISTPSCSVGSCREFGGAGGKGKKKAGVKRFCSRPPAAIRSSPATPLSMSTPLIR